MVVKLAPARVHSADAEPRQGRHAPSWLDAFTSAAYRSAYLVAMFTGVRAAANRIAALNGSLSPELASLHRTTVKEDRLGPLIVSVHPYARRETLGRGGMLSVRLRRPAMHPLVYRAICMTSHFGNGHVELAFVERAGELTFFAIRNTARANAERLGRKALAKRLRLAPSGEDVLTLRAIAGMLEGRGFRVRMAPAPECIAFAVNERLLAPERMAAARAALVRKYERLGGAF